MKKQPEFYLCECCGNLAEMVHCSGVKMVCCGQPMKQLQAFAVDAAKEKHVPKVSVCGSELIVEVGQIHHPMEEEHHISWVYVKSEKGCQRKDLCHNDKPITEFALTQDDEPKEVYAYCNLHGLWETKI